MRILALETATRAGSWALLEDGRLVGSGEGDAREPHDRRLPQPLMAMLGAEGLTVRDVDFLAVATGPGSFTGLRVGIATMQGLAMATGKRVIPIPTLDAIAEAAAAEPEAAGLDYIAVWLDGQRREIFAALYAMRPQHTTEGHGHGAVPALLMPPQVASPAVLAAEMSGLIGDARAGFAGDGAHRYKTAIDTLGLREARLFPVRPIAPHLARLAARHTGSAVLPHAVVPVYVRRTDAERARDRADAPVTPGS